MTARFVPAATFVSAFAPLYACSSTPPPQPGLEQNVSSSSDGIKRTLDELAAFGEKRVGTAGGAKAADYVMARMKEAGLLNVHFEPFNFPQHVADLASSTFSVTSNGQAQPKIDFDVFEGSGAGDVESTPIVFVGSAKQGDLAGKDLKGKVAFVKRDSRFHRSSQYLNVTQAGAVAMLYESTVPDNQIQIGSIRHAWEAIGTIPAITIGQDDGEHLQQLLNQGEVSASIKVTASTSHGTGRNVVGVVPGKTFGQPGDHQIVIGAHYDTWYVGSVDNGCGVAALLDFAGRRAPTGGVNAYTLVFVAYDGEEVALYGGYDYLRKHQDDGMLAVINFEMPAAEPDVLGGGLETLVRGVASSQVPIMDEALDGVTGVFNPFLISVSLDKIERMFGGIIPTDIQGTYRSGIPTVSTASDSPFYHTKKDTPDKVATDFLARGVRSFDGAVDTMMKSALDAFKGRDATLWDADVEVISRGPDDPQALVKVTLRDEAGKALAQTDVTGTLFCDDFFAAPDRVVKTDASGVAFFAFKQELVGCAGKRYVHVSAGRDYPLVEKVRAVPSR
jgi:Iap family predicted aminopeptidase